MKENLFLKQADLLVQMLPFIHAEPCFALKGGTAINFFVRDFPRLSVDIDLVYLPVGDRQAALRGIGKALHDIATKIRRVMPGTRVHEQKLAGEELVVKLNVRAQNGAGVKIEPGTVLRGALFPTEDRHLAPRAARLFARDATMRTVSVPDLYGGKLCAALDRQHPRDLFDVHVLLKNEGITKDIRRAFVVFLASHDRPMNELLAPNRKDLKRVYADQFQGMTFAPVSLADLEYAREELITQINAGLTEPEREFLLSLKRMEPKWDLLGIPGVERLPGPQWKLHNLRKMDPKKRALAEKELRRKLRL